MPAELVLVLGAAGAFVAYLVACRWWPFAACFRCGGTGKRASTGAPFFIIGSLVVVAGVATGLGPLGLLGAAIAALGLLVKGGSFRNCPRCQGTGRRQRAGRPLVRPSK